jgi:hypothetical protein
MRRPAALALAALLAAGVAALSRVPYTPEPGDHARVRLSWRVPGEYVEECRTVSAAERESQPVHMRRERVCEGRLLPYRLSVRLNGEPVLEETVRAAGAREDRPLYVFRDLDLPPGEYRLEIDWRAEAAPDSARRLGLAATLSLAAREIALVTYDPNVRGFRIAGPAAAAD